MPETEPSLAERLIKMSELIYERTVRGDWNTIYVAAASPLYEAIQRGEFRSLGIEPGSGVLVDAGIDPKTGKLAGGLLRLDTPGPPSAVDLLAELARHGEVGSDVPS